MQMIPLDTWQPHAGTAVRWQPTTESASRAGASPAYDGPITFLTENHVKGAIAAANAGRPHRAFIGTATDVDADLDTDAMTIALTTLTAM